MAFYSLRAAVPSPPPRATKDSLPKRCDEVRVFGKESQMEIKKRTERERKREGTLHFSHQGRRKNKQLNIVSCLSRRDMVSSLSGVLVATFLAIDSTEARSVKPETRRKIREKLDKLREKGGVPKEKEPSTADKEKLPANPPSSLTMPLVEAYL